MNRSLVFTALTFLGAALAAPAAFANRLDKTITLGGSATGSIAAAGDVSTVGFLVNAGLARNLTFQVKPSKGSKLAPSGTLIAPDGTVVDILAAGGKVVAKPTLWTAKLPNVAQTGLWRLEVRGGPTSVGGFTATIKGKDAVSLKSSKTSPPAFPNNGKHEVVIEAGDNVALTVAVKRASGNKTLVPQLAIFDSFGSPLQATPVASGNDKTGVMTLKSYRLPLFGKYTLRFTGKGGTGGAFSYAITTAPAKIKGTLPTAVPGGSLEAEPGMPAEIDGSLSQAGAGGSLLYRWVQVSGPAVTLTGQQTPTCTFTAPELGTASVIPLGFQLAVIENGAISKAMSVGVEVAKRPVADAGPSQVIASAAAGSLSGAGSFDRRGTGLRYSWRQVPGDDVTVALTGATTATPTFTAPAGNHTLHFGLTVDDGNARSFEDVVVVEVGTANTSVADAGHEQYVQRMATVHLCGLATITPTGVLDSGLQWTQVSGPPVTLAGATKPWPSFTAPRTAGDLVFELTAGGVAATADRVTVHVRPTETNLPPVAKGNGPLNAPSGQVDMAATATTDPDGTTQLFFRWAQTAGAGLPLTNASAVTSSTTLPAGNETYTFAVIAHDGLQYGSPDLESVRNSGYIGLPIALAGPDQKVNQGTTVPVTVTLDGRQSARTDGGTGLTYAWTQISGKDWFDVTTSPLAWDPTIALPKFRLPLDVSSLASARTLTFQLVVTGGALTSNPDFVTVTIDRLPSNGKPVVSAQVSDAAPLGGQTVTLTGTASDNENDPMTYEWKQVSGPAVVLQPSATAIAPAFAAPASGTVVFTFTADDGFDKSTTAPLNVVVNAKPVARVVVTPSSGIPGTLVTMDGITSSDDGGSVTYLWTQTAGQPLGMGNPTTSAISFTAPTGVVTFRLVVNDGKQDSNPVSGSFSGSPPPSVSPSVTGVDTTVNPTFYGNSASYAAYGSTVTLNANPNGSGYTYVWRQINAGSDPVVSTLSSTTTQNPTFTVPSPTSTSGPFGQSPQATFGVIATEPTTQQSSPEVTVTVRFFASYNNQTVSQGSTVYSIISSRCTSCHFGTSNTYTGGSGNNAGFYGMGTATAFLNNSRGQNTYSSSSKKRLPTSSNAALGQSSSNAYTYDRITGTATTRMPSSGGYLNSADQYLIQDWIDQGVQNN